MADPVFHPRLIEGRLAEALQDAPVVLIHGPRQRGKTTLAQYGYDGENVVRFGDRLKAVPIHRLWMPADGNAEQCDRSPGD